MNYLVNTAQRITGMPPNQTANGVKFGNVLVVSAAYDIFLNKVNIRAQSVLGENELLSFSEALSSMEYCLKPNTTKTLPEKTKADKSVEFYADNADNLETDRGQGQESSRNLLNANTPDRSPNSF